VSIDEKKYIERIGEAVISAWIDKKRALYKECGGSKICEHGKERRICKECGGSQICEHE
jgi:hypothetical protein